MWKTTVVLVASLLLAACAPVTAAQSLAAPVDPRLSSLWIDMSVAPKAMDAFNRVATARDIARADHVSLVDMLDQVETAQRLVVFKNVSDAEMLVPRLADKMDIIGFNLEHGPTNRMDEQRDPVGSVLRARTLADQYGMQLAFGPDHNFAVDYGVDVAPYVDIFVLQVQRVQTEPQTVRDFVIPLVGKLRQANPNVKVSVQLRTEGDTSALADLLISLDGVVDGVSILTNDDTADVAGALLAELRVPVAEAPEKPAPAATGHETQAALVETPTPATRRTALATVEPVSGSAPLAQQDTPVRSLLLLSSLAVVGVILSGVVTTVLLYTVKRGKRR